MEALRQARRPASLLPLPLALVPPSPAPPHHPPTHPPTICRLYDARMPLERRRRLRRSTSAGVRAAGCAPRERGPMPAASMACRRAGGVSMR